MDSIFAIGFGLALRFVVDTVGRNNLKLTGTIIGLWEGIVLLHFLQKMPYSFDPYVGYAVRLFIDFLFTESITRLLLVVVWSGLGVVLADVAPGIWHDTGMRKAWHRLRRELFLLTRSVPTLTPFTKPRIVRFSPSRTASIISSATFTPVPRAPKRPVPGFFPGEVSETETQSSLSGSSPASPPVSLSVPIHDTDTESLASGQGMSRDFAFPSMPSQGNDDLYASSSSSDTTEQMDPTTLDLPEIVVAEEEPNTPKQDLVVFPPTPEDSPYEPPQEERVVTPPASEVPVIPDLPETGIDTDWENVEMEDGAPTPPPKDDPMRPLKMFPSSSRAPSQVRSETIAPSSSKPLDESKAWSEVDASLSGSPFEFKADSDSPPAMPIPVHYSQAQVPSHDTALSTAEPPIILSPATDSPADDDAPNPVASSLQHSHSMATSISQSTEMASNLARASSINKDILNLTPEDQTNPPPPYRDPALTTDEAESPEVESGQRPPTPSSDISVTSTSSLLRDARDHHTKMTEYINRDKELERQIEALEADGEDGLSLKLLKTKELEALRRKMAKTRERAERKFHYDNLEEQSNEIELGGMTAQKALEATEKRLAYLLSEGKLDKPLNVTVPKAPKGRSIKTKLHTAMKEYVSILISFTCILAD
ncbi:uncharacterized protein EV420DRAFT_1642041 [Desarmillaria tabescens]|uniref:Uncharacterized protein n=1 Tax=Armillaria tabescens TaxID=1929756 RepID=A0AA39N732_ARMTA|nr:uncharacterized protein EV420DRAFT_1642041 [Desarmillaria tabescens]KAK0459858.1 hypothetical protein EV420DRAFT_1642041 [Desarmillaria tabescens]